MIFYYPSDTENLIRLLYRLGTAMQITKFTLGVGMLEAQIDDEDLATFDVLHHELLNNKRVIFAGVISHHPLLKRTTLKLTTKDVIPSDVVLDTCEKVTGNIAKLGDEIEKALESQTHQN